VRRVSLVRMVLADLPAILAIDVTAAESTSETGSRRCDGLRAQYPGQPPTVLTPAMEARILEKTR
jgi:hypothetical protein